MYDDTVLTDLRGLEWVPHPEFPGVSIRTAHGRLGADELTQLLIRLAPDGGEIPVHDHERLDECFYVIQGVGDALVRGERRRVGAHASLYAPAGKSHGLRNAGDEPLLLLATFIPAIDP